MYHKVKVMVETTRPGLFGPKKVREERTIQVDSKTYREMMKTKKNKPYSIEEMMLYDDIWDD